MLHLHFSNHYEHLRDALLTQIALPCANPLESQQVIVPSAALQRDLTLKGAERHGIFANVQFGYLAQWLWRQIARFVPVSDNSPFAAPVLTWRIFEALGDASLVQSHPRLQSWLSQADDVMRFEFSQRSATLFETYTTYRPQWLERWLHEQPAGPLFPSAAARADEAWQAHLWRILDARLQLPTRDPVADFLKALSTLTPAQALEQGLSASAHVFCLPAIAPVHLSLLQAIGRISDLHLYVLNPCEAFWFDLVDTRRLNWLKARNRHEGLEAGHPLLAAWGQQTQSHLSLLFDHLGDHTTEHGHFEAPAGTSLLAQLQRSLLMLQPLEPGSLTLAPSDRSLEIRSCHSLSRELEVLHDFLLGLLTTDATGDLRGDAPLQPSDVLVVTPDLDAAAPLIEAVFGTVTDPRRIDWTITGRARSRTNAPARALLGLLTLADSRVTATEVFSLLQQEVVARRFALDDAALQHVHTWLRQAGFHWAFNPEQLADLQLPEQAAHSLEDALDRLFLGYALPDAVDAPFVGRLPAAPIEGSASAHLGALWRFTQLLGELRTHCAEGLTPAQWGQCLSAALDTCIDARGDQIDDLRELRISVQTLVEQMHAGHLSGTLRLPVVRAALQSVLEDPARGGVPGGRVTFASMSSLRNLPYRVVCAIGLNAESFPSNRRPAEFDLLALNPRPGDRQHRIDERNLFLDLLLSARQVLYLSHSGRSSRDNTLIPPSTLIDELLDAISRAAVMIDPESDDASASSIPASAPLTPGRPSPAQAIRHHLTLEHPLQAFSPRAFLPAQSGADPRLQSFNAELAQALNLRHASTQAPAATGPEVSDADGDANPHTTAASPFFYERLPLLAGAEREVSLEQLVRFFRQPCRYLLEHRLGVQHPRAEDALTDEEPFTLSADARQRLAHRLLPALLDGKQAADLIPLARAGTELPQGSVGDALLRSEIDTLSHFAQRMRVAALPQRLPAHTVDLRLPVQGETWRLHAVLTDLPASGPLHWRYAKLQGTDCLRSWITLLAASAAAVPDMAARASFIARNGLLRLRAPEHPSALLSELLSLYRRGLTEPLPFFPYSSWACVSGKSENMAAARTMWDGHRAGSFAESDDPAYQLALRGLPDPIGLEFLTLSRQVFGPLLEHVDERP